MRFKTAALVAVVVATNVSGNFALSWGMRHAPSGLIVPLAHPMCMLGIGLLITWMVTRIKLFGIADLSWVLPVTSVGYVLTALAGALFLQETVSVARWLGVVFIVMGASLVGLASHGEPI